MEERLATVEKDLATFQRDAGRAIHDTDHNNTILLGLVYKQNVDIKDILENIETIDMRLGSVEQRIGRVEYTLVEHSKVLAGHTQVLDEHTKVLAGHTQILNEHTVLLNKHTARFDRLEALLGQVLERLAK